MSKRDALAADRYGFTEGRPRLESVGAITFGLDDVIFVADNRSAAVVAIDLGTASSSEPTEPFEVARIDARLAAYLGCDRGDVWIRDLAVRPNSSDVYLSVMRGSGEAAIPILALVAPDGSISTVDLERVPHARRAIEDAPSPDDARKDGRSVRGEREGAPYNARGVVLQIAFDPLRTVTITDLAFVDGTVLVAGASNEEFSSSLRRIPFPFDGGGSTTSLEIFHVNHGKYETASPIRNFVPYAHNTAVIASYTCTPIVQFALADLAPGSHVHGRTVADLGARNTPLDMISYRRDGDEYLLVCNSRHPLVKIAASDIDRQPPLTESNQGPAGVLQSVIAEEGVLRMAAFGPDQVLMLRENGQGGVDLRSLPTARL